MIRRIWTDEALADYIRDELGFPGARQGAMVEPGGGGHSHRGGEPGVLVSADQPEFPAVRTKGTASAGFRNHWSVENSLHHVKDRSWDEDVHTLRRPGLGEVYATLVNTALNALRLEGWFPRPDVQLPLRAKTCAFRPMQTIARLLPVKPPDFAIVLGGIGRHLPLRRCFPRRASDHTARLTELTQQKWEYTIVPANLSTPSSTILYTTYGVHIAQAVPAPSRVTEISAKQTKERTH